LFKAENGTAISGYLYQIAKNKWVDHLRSSKFKRTVPFENYHEGLDDKVEEKESKLKEIESCFLNLGENCKELLTRFYYKKENMSVIAKALGWTVGTVRNNKYRCIQRLKEMLINKA